jgi:hypothetical protein
MSIRPFKTGACRGLGSLLPPRIEDYVELDNPVRGIEAYVSMLGLAALGFRHADRDGGAGQPPYDPADLLKLSPVWLPEPGAFLAPAGARGGARR